jgi:DNA-binding NtrC family response regulator
VDEKLYPTKPILLVDDEQMAIQGFQFTLEAAGLLNTIGCQDSRRVIDLMAERDISVVVLDLSMPHVTGEELLPQLREGFPGVPVIVVTGTNDVATAVECMQAGAFEYLLKPVEETKLASAVRRAIEMGELRSEYTSFKDKVLSNTLDHPEAFSQIITNNAKMHSVFQYIETISVSSRPVLVTGDTGVGKELIARSLHELGEYDGAFVAVNVAGLDDNAFSDTLFGHTKGAFTGADTVRPGLIERASGGTLFLDEIGDLESASQVKLLRLLQENEYYPLGADAAKPATARVVVATNRNIREMLEAKQFRADLFYRLQTHEIHVPPLRERMDDIPTLVDYFLDQAAESLKKRKPTPPPELFTLLGTYHFPGNVRELESVVFDAVSRHKSHMLSCEVFRNHIEKDRPSGQTQAVAAPTGDTTADEAPSPFALFGRLPTMSEAPVLLIQEAMKRADGNQTVAAQMLGITRSGLSKAIKRHQESGE